jgi:hypothetical protein
MPTAVAPFVPKAYCKYGCPTGALLEFVRSRGPCDRFTARDAVAAALLLTALALHRHHAAVHAWIFGAAG